MSFGAAWSRNAKPQLVRLRLAACLRRHGCDFVDRLPQRDGRRLFGCQRDAVHANIINRSLKSQSAARADAQGQLKIHGPSELIEQNV